MAGGLGFYGNSSSNNTIYPSGVMSPLQIPLGEQYNTCSTYCYMDTIGSTSYCVGGDRTSNNVATQGGGVSFSFPHSCPSDSQFSYVSWVDTNIIPSTTSIIELDHTMQEVAETRSTIQTSVVTNSNRVNSDTSMNVDYGQQYHREVDTTTDRGQDVVRGNISAEADALSMGEDNYAIDWVEHEMPKLLEDHMIDRDCLPLPESTSISDLVLASDMPDILGFVNEVYLHDDTDR